MHSLSNAAFFHTINIMTSVFQLPKGNSLLNHDGLIMQTNIQAILLSVREYPDACVCKMDAK